MKLCHTRRWVENRNKCLNMNHRLQAAYTFLEEIITTLSLLLFLGFYVPRFKGIVISFSLS